MSNKLFIFSDGTGARGGVTYDSNVFRLYNMLDRSKHQLAFYADGVGTQENSILRTIGGVFGWGVTNNVIQAYRFLANNYVKADPDNGIEASKIYFFGFSRGAYTVRLLLGLLLRCGLVDKTDINESKLNERVLEVRKAFRSRHQSDSDEQLKQNIQVQIEFIGVWDTVDAVGVPFDELKPLVKWFPWLMGKRSFGFQDRILKGCKVARQALAIDDQRRTFHPNFWSGAQDYTDDNGQQQPIDLKQVWFCGSHTDVGGGYAKNGLSYVALDWMLAEIEQSIDIDLYPEHIKDARQRANDSCRLHDPRAGLGVFYRYSPRRLPLFPTGKNDIYHRWLKIGLESSTQEITVHISVWNRIERNIQAYAPIFINTSEIDQDGKVNVAYTNNELSLYHHNKHQNVLKNQAFPTLSEQRTKKINFLVRCRQFFYGLFVITFFTGVSLGLFHEVPIQNKAIAPLCHELAADKVAIDSPVYEQLCIPKPFDAAKDNDSSWSNYMATGFKSLLPRNAEKIVDNAYAYPVWGWGFFIAIICNYFASRGTGRKIASYAREGWEEAIDHNKQQQQ